MKRMWMVAGCENRVNGNENFLISRLLSRKKFKIYYTFCCIIFIFLIYYMYVRIDIIYTQYEWYVIACSQFGGSVHNFLRSFFNMLRTLRDWVLQNMNMFSGISRALPSSEGTEDPFHVLLELLVYFCRTLLNVEGVERWTQVKGQAIPLIDKYPEWNISNPRRSTYENLNYKHLPARCTFHNSTSPSNQPLFLLHFAND